LRKYLFVLILFAFFGNAYCEDIAYVVTQNSSLLHLQRRISKVADVKKGDTVFFQGRIRTEPVSMNFGRWREFEVLVRNERGTEGWINSDHILLQNNQPLSDSITRKRWMHSHYQDIILEQKRETVFKHEPFWRDEYNDYARDAGDMKTSPWWAYFQPTQFYLRNNVVEIHPIAVGAFIYFITTNQWQDDTSILLQVICVNKHYVTPYENNYLTSLFNVGETYRLLLKIDGDYMDVFVNNNPTKICTLIGVDDYFLKTVVDIVKEKTVDLSRIVWPRRADSSMDYPPPVGALLSPNTSQEIEH